MSPTCHSNIIKYHNLFLTYFFWECSRSQLAQCQIIVQSLVKSRQTTDNRQTESDAYEPIVQYAQVG